MVWRRQRRSGKRRQRKSGRACASTATRRDHATHGETLPAQAASRRKKGGGVSGSTVAAAARIRAGIR